MSKRIPRNIAISETLQSLRRLSKAVQDYSQEVSKKFGITGPQLWALKTIYVNGSLSLGELSQKMYLHPSTISGITDRLEDKGYVMRGRAQEDRRVVKVYLTTEGKKLVKKTPNPFRRKVIVA